MLATPSRPRTALLLLAAVFFIAYFNFRASLDHTLPRFISESASQRRDEIPNILHYAWTLPSKQADFAFEFKHFLSLYASQRRWRPEKTYIHTNAPSDAIARARAGKAGKWSQLIFSQPGVEVRYTQAPTHARNGARITFEEHKTDFIRAEALHDIGGVYIDWDVYAMLDIAPLRRSGFAAVVGRIEGRQHQVNSGAILTRKGSELSRIYRDRMHRVYDGTYVTHSNLLLTAIAERLVRVPGEVLILDQNAFTPGSWLSKHLYMLYEVQKDVKSNLEGVKQGDRLPEYTSYLEPEAQPDADRKTSSWDEPDNLSYGWERRFFDSYMIHAFQPGVRDIEAVEGFGGITPRYVLERRSNFARALYPVVWELYDRGIVGFDDFYNASGKAL